MFHYILLYFTIFLNIFYYALWAKKLPLITKFSSQFNPFQKFISKVQSVREKIKIEKVVHEKILLERYE